MISDVQMSAREWLRKCPEAVARAWVRIVADRDGYSAASSLQSRLTALNREIVAWLLAPSPDGAAGRAIGASLADAFPLDLEVWESMQDRLLEHLRTHFSLFPSAEAAALEARLGDLLPHLTAGFYRRRAEKLRTERNRSQAILHSVGDGVALTDQELGIEEINWAFTALTGYVPAAVRGRSLVDLLGDSLRETDWSVLQRRLSNHRAWHGRAILRHRKGGRIKVAVTVAGLRDAQGKLTGYVFSCQDVESWERLRQAQKLFAHNTSHQLRTPVANLKLYVHLLQRRHTTGYFQVLESQIDRLSDLVQKVLRFTTLENGEGVGEWEPVSLSRLVEENVARHRAEAEAAQLTLSCPSLPPDLPAVEGDKALLGQALSELLENAISFTPPGGRVAVEARRVERDGQPWVALSVHDSGPAIPLEARDMLFEPFFRGAWAETGQTPGLGLGLSIAHDIVEAHGGVITLDRNGREGKAFTLWLKGFDLTESPELAATGPDG